MSNEISDALYDASKINAGVTIACCKTCTRRGTITARRADETTPL
jgi:hypothetical protein